MKDRVTGAELAPHPVDSGCAVGADSGHGIEVQDVGDICVRLAWRLGPDQPLGVDDDAAAGARRRCGVGAHYVNLVVDGGGAGEHQLLSPVAGRGLALVDEQIRAQPREFRATSGNHRS